jgi:hypothetical protein
MNNRVGIDFGLIIGKILDWIMNVFTWDFIELNRINKWIWMIIELESEWY